MAILSPLKVKKHHFTFSDYNISLYHHQLVQQNLINLKDYIFFGFLHVVFFMMFICFVFLAYNMALKDFNTKFYFLLANS